MKSGIIIFYGRKIIPDNDKSMPSISKPMNVKKSRLSGVFISPRRYSFFEF